MKRYTIEHLNFTR